MKNPERPDDMDNIISECANPIYEHSHNPEEEIKRLVFGE